MDDPLIDAPRTSSQYLELPNQNTYKTIATLRLRVRDARQSEI
jgi:hypothetical protein